ncbi:hypothetical protein [Alicyclobacillus acidiphilus]|uniref:hypothetical protein n=1 Tax=Alicyclobacillus acidiphilus TaxID=182455 RepID=UPI0008315EB3|nr:hypothetical protein [Alicyclobacillus acidiphilus]
MKRWWVWIGIVVVVLLIIVVPFVHMRNVLAVRQTDTLISQSTTTIPKGQSIADVVVLGHNVNVSGNVYELLFVVNGDIHLGPTARADMVIDLGGTVREAPGAHVNQLFHISLTTPFWNGALVGVLLAAMVWGGFLFLSIVMVMLSVIVTWVLRNRLHVPLNTMDRSIRKTGVIGLLTSIGAIAVIALLSITIIGIPLAGVFALVYAVVGVIGLGLVSLWLGKFAFRNSSTERPAWLMTLLGSSLLAAFCNIPFVGLVLFALFWCVGVGVTTVWGWNAWRTRKSRRG